MDENLTANKNKSERRSVSRDSPTHLTQTRPEERQKERERTGEKRTHTLTHPIQFEADEEAGGSGGLCTQGVGEGGRRSAEWWTRMDTGHPVFVRLPGDTHALLLAFVWSPDELSLILMFPAHHVHAAALSSRLSSFPLRYDSINMTGGIGGILSSFFPYSHSTSPRAYITYLFSLLLSSAVSSLIYGPFLLHLMSRKIHIRVVFWVHAVEKKDLWLPSPSSFSVSLAAIHYPNSSNSVAAMPRISQ